MEQEIQFCKNPRVNRTLNEAYQISRTIPFNPNSYIYLDEIYQVFHDRIESDPEFLKNAECLYAHNLFEYILKNSLFKRVLICVYSLEFHFLFESRIVRDIFV
jgi:hypothetical protein